MKARARVKVMAVAVASQALTSLTTPMVAWTRTIGKARRDCPTKRTKRWNVTSMKRYVKVPWLPVRQAQVVTATWKH